MSELIRTELYTRVMHVIDLVSQGRTVTRACAAVGVNVLVFRRTVDANAELKDMLTEAEHVGRDVLADTLLRIDSDPEYGDANPQMAKVKSDNIKWWLSKQDVNKFGDKVTVNTHLTADKAIIDAIQQSKQRLLTGGYQQPLADIAVEDAEIVGADGLTDAERAELALLY